MKILVVDDEVSILQLIKMNLEIEGHIPITAENALDALELVIKEKPDIIILDTPRSRVHPKALDYVIKFNAPQIIYVSCNPKTLVTDLKVLESKGYEIEKTLLMDMFPNTPHVEKVVKLNKK